MDVDDSLYVLCTAKALLDCEGRNCDPQLQLQAIARLADQAAGDTERRLRPRSGRLNRVKEARPCVPASANGNSDDRLTVFWRFLSTLLMLCASVDKGVTLEAVRGKPKA